MAAASTGAGCGDSNVVGREDIKTQFTTREGMYKLITLSDCLRPSRVPQNGPTNTPVKLSFLSLGDGEGKGDRICFNIGKELYFYQYAGIVKVLDLTRPLDKRVYRGTLPTCHDFNTSTTSPEHVMLIIGFSAGQIQLIDPISKELSRLFNEERATDKTKVTCIRWVPGSVRQFVASYASGQLYVYDVELSCNSTSSASAMQHYQLTARGESFMVYASRAKTLYNPVQRWTVGTGPINEFAFSPCGHYIAIVSADGYLRIFTYGASEIVGSMRSYFGGLLCVAWSPDGRYIATGGEDDLVTIWSFSERRVICRGRGHRSWVGGVAFDPYASFNGHEFVDFCGSDDDFSRLPDVSEVRNSSKLGDSSPDSTHSPTDPTSSYRLGSIGHDAMLCLWDITDEVLRRPICRTRTSTIASRSEVETACTRNGVVNSVEGCGNEAKMATATTTTSVISPPNSVVQKFATFALGDRPVKDKQRRSASSAGSDQRWHFSLTSRSSDSKIQLLKATAAMTTGCVGRTMDDAVRLLGTPACPRLTESPMLVPLVGKRIAHERLTALVFREDCVVTACQEGVIYTWARPGKAVLNQQSPTSSTQANANNTAL